MVGAFTRAGVTDWKRIVIASRDPLLAARTWFTLDDFGQGYRASLLDGGMARWIAEKRPLTTQTPYVEPARFTFVERPYSKMFGAEVKQIVRDRGKNQDHVAIIDARPLDAFLAGHIPGAESIPWMENFTADGLLRPPDDLRGIYALVAGDVNPTVIAYCRTGMQASVTYFVLRYLGYDVTLYDGSFAEWSTANDAVVEKGGM